VNYGLGLGALALTPSLKNTTKDYELD